MGLISALQDFGFTCLALPACRTPLDFALPVALGVDLTTLGGISYNSVGCLRSLESCASSEILHDWSNNFSMVLRVNDFIVVIFALPTPADVESDKVWACELVRGAEAGEETRKQWGARKQ